MTVKTMRTAILLSAFGSIRTAFGFVPAGCPGHSPPYPKKPENEVRTCGDIEHQSHN